MTDSLAIIPLYLREERDAKLARKTIETLQVSAPELEVLVVDDCSPMRELAGEVLEEFDDLGVHVHQRDTNDGFSKTVNVGLRRARDSGQNAILINSDMEFIQRGWVERMEAREEAVVGGLLIYPNGLIQHAGIFYTVIRREFDHIYRLAPGSLEAAHKERICPVTGALQFIRHECLEGIGLYDENFRLGYEDVDYCHRVFKSGRQCVYDPGIMAIHHEGQIRSREPDDKMKAWMKHSWDLLHEKWAGHDFSEYIPTLIAELDDAQ